MKPKINYSYTIGYKPLCCYHFLHYGVDETCYKHRILPHIDDAVKELLKNPISRHATIVTLTETNYACLISLQFQIVKNKLIMIANFRSQCKTNGRPSDTVMLRWIATKVMKMLELKRFKIYVNVANYHDNKELTEANKQNEEVQRNLRILKYLL